MIEIDSNTIVTEIFLECFKELHLKKQSNHEDLKMSVQKYCEQLNSGRVKYLREKILFISNKIDLKSLNLEQKKSLFYINTFLDSYSQIVKKSDSDILDEILNPEFEELNKAEDPIKLDLTQAEILGIIEGIFQVFSKEKISSTKLFKFCYSLRDAKRNVLCFGWNTPLPLRGFGAIRSCIWFLVFNYAYWFFYRQFYK